MTGRKFKADAGSASSKVEQGLVPGITNITANSDGEVVIAYSHTKLGRKQITIRALAQDVSDYPVNHSFMLFTEEDDTATDILEALTKVQQLSFGSNVYEMLSLLSKKLGNALEGTGKEEDDTEDSPAEVEDDAGVDPSSEEYDYQTEGDDDDDDDWSSGPAPRLSRGGNRLNEPMSDRQKQALHHLKQDAQIARRAGFRVGIVHGFEAFNDIGILSVSIRVYKLGLSEDALQVWDIQDTDYVVLLLRYQAGYISLETVLERAAINCGMEYRIGLCQRYKPSLTEAQAAFADKAQLQRQPTESDGRGRFQSMHVSASLNQFLNEAFVSLVKLRLKHKTDWDTANEIFISQTGLGDHDEMVVEHDFPAQQSETTDQAHDHILNQDHLMEANMVSNQGQSPNHGCSFPLVAIQFALRFFTKCTKYCLRCHRKMDEDFEALRPYVCSDPLCLFQYMSLGLGPDLEQEILIRPAVVDLLVSLCYASLQPSPSRAWVKQLQDDAKSGRYCIREFPVGLRIRVPLFWNISTPAQTSASSAGHASLNTAMTVGMAAMPLPSGSVVNQGAQVLMTPGQQGSSGGSISGQAPVIIQGSQSQTQATQGGQVEPGTPGQLQPIQLPQKAGIRGTINYPETNTIVLNCQTELDRLSRGQRLALRHIISTIPHFQDRVPDHDVIVIGTSSESSSLTFRCPYLSNILGERVLDAPPRVITATTPAVEVELFPYDVDLDDLPDEDKCIAIRYLLDSLPRISELREFLLTRSGGKLRSCEHISPASYSLLRWIVSSNRSYIQQVSDGLQGVSNPKTGYIPGIDGWMQFRFSQGSPDREARFQTALREVAQRRGSSHHPTIFAWHGSSLANWHSILRSGLDFKDVSTGRAFGNGVYFSTSFDTSTSYTYSYSRESDWAMADTPVSSVMSLNEIINAPQEFVSTDPHYVVSQPDWHQCRYLFVKKDLRARNPLPQVAASTSQAAPAPTGALLKQAPGREIRGPANQILHLPVGSMPPGLHNINGQKADKSDSTIRTLDEDSEGDDAIDRQLLARDDDHPDNNESLGKRSRDSSATSVLQRKRCRSTTDARPPTPAMDESLTDFRPGTLDLETLPRLEPPSWATGAATQALSRELKKLQATQAKTPLHELGWFIDFNNVINLFQWVVELHSFDSSLPFAQDMKTHGITSIVAEIRFGKDWPLTPPFVRIIRPRFLPFVHGGGGHVTGGGAMCLELLTNTGWSPANSIESVIIQVRIALTNLDPRPARLQPAGDYGILEAIEAYERVAAAHGWAVPPDLKATALGGEEDPVV